MKQYNLFFSTFLTLAALFSFSSCRDEALYNSGVDYDGPVSLTLDFSFEPLAKSELGTRGVPGNLDFQIRNLRIYFYDANESQTASDAAPVRYEEYKNIETSDDENAEDSDISFSSNNTEHGIVTIKDVKAGKYHIYAVANVDELPAGKSWDRLTEDELKSLKITWPEYKGPSGQDADLTAPATYSVPDAMFGHFYNDDNKDSEIVTLNKSNLLLKADLKRVVSKLNIGFDGSRLNNDVEVYIKSVRIVNAPSTCFLGKDNSVGNENVTAYDSKYATSDPRLYHEYSDDFRDSGEALAPGKVFPRQNDKDENDSDWQAFVFGNSDNPNPKYKSEPTTLYFFENMQGTADKSSKDEVNKKKPNATYVEVSAYYKKMAGAESDDSANGYITYWFMLGQNTTDDFNVSRNYHYRLTLILKNDAKTPEWSLNFDQVQDEYYFRIPYNPTTDGIDEYPNDGFNYAEKGWGLTENWNRSSVWYAYLYENGEYYPVAEIAKELIFVKEDASSISTSPRATNGVYYQVVTVYPMTTGDTEQDFGYNSGSLEKSYSTDQLPTKKGITNLRKGKIVQVLKDENNSTDLKIKKGGGNIAMFYSYEKHNVQNYKVPLATGNVGTPSNMTYQNMHTNLQACHIPYVMADISSAHIKGTSGNGSNNYLYVKCKVTTNTIEIEPIDDPETLGKLDRLVTYPYIVTDYDPIPNEYPVVKLGSSYWLRENLRTKTLSNKLVLVSSEVAEQSRQEFDDGKAGKYKDFNDCAGNMKAAALNSEDSKVSVYMYEKKPGYKYIQGDENGKKYGLFYNFAAVAGFTSEMQEKNENGETIKSWTKLDELPVEFNDFPILTTLNEKTRKGYGHFYQQGEKYKGKDNRDNDIDSRITPDGWHLPSTLQCDPDPFYKNIRTSDPSIYTTDNSVSFGEYIDDIDYMQFYMNGYLTRAAVNKDIYEWPENNGNKINSNISGLSFLALPINGVGTVKSNFSSLNECRNLIEYIRKSSTGSTTTGPFTEEIDYDEIVNQYVAPFWTPALWYSGRSMWSEIEKDPNKYAIFQAEKSIKSKYVWLDRFTSGYVSYLPMFYIYSSELYLDIFNLRISYEQTYPFHSSSSTTPNENYPEHYTTSSSSTDFKCYNARYGLSQTSFYPFYKYLSEQYLPVRCVRDSYPDSYKAQDGAKLNSIYAGHSSGDKKWDWNDDILNK